MRQAGHATRKRLLDAAKDEFAQYGLAGARINRIAASARASKDRLYAYFPGKEELFTEVIRRWLIELEAAAQPSGDDMPGYVGRLFDHFDQNPSDGRLAAWAQLETPQNAPEGAAGHRAELAILQSAIDAVRAGQADGRIDASWVPVELVLVLIGVARSMAVPGWSASTLTRGQLGTAAQRRATAVATAARLVRPLP